MDEARPTVLVVQHEDAVPLRLLGDWLADEGCDLTVVRPDRGDPLPAIDADTDDGTDAIEVDALVVLGGTMDSWDDAAHPWFAATRELVVAAGRQGVPVLGICLGHQLMVQAYGGRVDRNPQGRTAGVVPVGWSTDAADDALLGRIARSAGQDAVAVHHNADVATRLPQEAAVLASTADGSPQAVRFAARVWGVQCHPEADAALVRRWERVREGDPDPVVVAEVLAAEQALTETWRPLAAALTDLAHARRAERHSLAVAPREEDA